jgi:hypothetical protein
MNLDGVTRAASWWRQQGFPVPPGTPEDALGTLNGGMVVFTWTVV